MCKNSTNLMLSTCNPSYDVTSPMDQHSSLSLTTTMIYLNILNKSMKTLVLPPGL